MPQPFVIRNASIFRHGSFDPDADAIGIRDGRIVAVGEAQEVAALVGPGAESFDAAGGLVSSAFYDSHLHPLQAGCERLACDLTDSTDAQDALRMVSEYAAAHPDAEWIIGGGWHLDHFPLGRPTAAQLEQVVPGRKVYLVNADHHGAWVSPAALATAHIDEHTPNPANGIIDRDQAGAPSGTLQESAMDMLLPFLPQRSLDDAVAGLVEAQRYVHQYGIAGWQDAIIGSYAGFDDSTDAYLTAFDRGLLSLRITGALWLRRDIGMDDIDEAVAGYIAHRDRVGNRTRDDGTGSLEVTSIKIMMDGVPESLTAYMKRPYLNPDGTPMATRGEGHFSPEFLRAIAPQLAAAGFQLHFHAIGDQAISDALDAIAAARAAGDNNAARHHIAHLQQLDLADIPRMKNLGVTANMQAFWACNSAQMLELNLPIVGPERFGEQYPFAALHRAGIPLAMGSDWPVSTPDPWQAIHVAVNRTEPGRLDQTPHAPESALELATALTAYTAGSAHLQHHGDVGDIAVGQRADIAIADRNPFTAPAQEIADVRNVATFVGGTPVFVAAN